MDDVMIPTCRAKHILLYRNSTPYPVPPTSLLDMVAATTVEQITANTGEEERFASTRED